MTVKKTTAAGGFAAMTKELRTMVDQLVLGEDEVLNWVRKARWIDSVTRLPGDASTRRYYRVNSKGNSYIVMRMEAFTEDAERIPFLAVQRHLKSAGVDVPQVLDMDPSRGMILLEDLGDITLLRRLQECATPELERHLYERVIDSLVDLQNNASKRRQNEAPIQAFSLRFDLEKLMWEVQFTIEHFYELYLKRKISDQDRKIMIDGFSEICRRLESEPTVLTHRDFHSRNVMVTAATPASGTPGVRSERFVMIDFQDARLGPAQYDLASLLKDSYYQLEETQIQRLLDYYVVRWEALTEQMLDRDRFRETFDWMAVQRNFKAIGSFASFLNRRGDATYLKYIGNTFENIRRTLLNYPRFARLREVLFHYYYF